MLQCLLADFIDWRVVESHGGTAGCRDARFVETHGSASLQGHTYLFGRTYLFGCVSLQARSCKIQIMEIKTKIG